jgi:two-component system, OmpR family, sensor histidine kinase KdpD
MPETEHRRPDPERLLKRLEAEQRHATRGRLKIFLGYASGVGKSFRMLDEGRRRKMRGQDVVVGATQPLPSPEIAEVLRSLEVIPLLDGQAVDVAAILRRHPGVCLIDGLAYENPPGSKNKYRWRDVEELLTAGISVITAINLQYVLEKQKEVAAIRGRVVKDAVPESFIRTADEIELVDVPPEYCVDRSLKSDGDGLQDAALLSRQLSELREIALLLAAEVVDNQLEGYLHRHGIEHPYGTHERVLVCITPRSNAEPMIRGARHVADRFHGTLDVVYVRQDDLNDRDRDTLDRNLACARESQADVSILEGEDPIASILNFVEKHGVTQIYVGHSPSVGWSRNWIHWIKSSMVERLILESDGVDVRVFPNPESKG